MKYGFIGAGNMGSAICNGFIKSGSISGADIYITRRNKAALKEQAAQMGVNACDSGTEVVKSSDVLFLAVKPNMFREVTDEVRDAVKDKMPLVVSMAAGLSTSDIEDMLKVKGVRVVRIMPNVNAGVSMSVTAYCKGKNATDEDLENVRGLLELIGTATAVDEKLFAVFSAIAGCSPAYVYMFINALAEGALKAGMNKKQAIEIAAAAVMGSAKTVIESGKHPEELNDMVCSPGGTTIEGVCRLKEKGFESAVIEAVSASVAKDRALSS
jgi:pyrroline-5-carboxylate reductase